MPSIRVLLSASHDPYFNLAVEDTIFQAMPTSQSVLFLWRNTDTVVIGKGQNPWKECNTKRMSEDGVKLVRRKTGGGAVFHDLGNSNFTFMAGKPGYNKAISTSIVLDAMKRLGIAGSASGRNDLVVHANDGPRKFSGSAYREKSDRGFHHGTLLLHADLTRLAHYLNPDPKKLLAKGIDSVRSRVANLNQFYPEIDHSKICDSIQKSFFEYHQEQVEPETIDPNSTPDLPGFEEIFQQQKNWDWNFGKTMQFSHELSERFAWGGVDVQLDVQQARIAQAKIFTDCLYPDELDRVAAELVGTNYIASDVFEAVSSANSGDSPMRTELTEIANWLHEAVK